MKKRPFSEIFSELASGDRGLKTVYGGEDASISGSEKDNTFRFFVFVEVHQGTKNPGNSLARMQASSSKPEVVSQLRRMKPGQPFYIVEVCAEKEELDVSKIKPCEGGPVNIELIDSLYHLSPD